MNNVKTYKYGILPPLNNIDLIKDQMYKSHLYYNKLIEIEIEKRKYIRSIIREDPEIQHLNLKLTNSKILENNIIKEIKNQHSIMKQRLSTQTDKEDLKKAKKESQDYLHFLIEKQKEIRNSKNYKLKFKEIKEKNSIKVKEARENSEIYWGTYFLTENAVDMARSMPIFNGSEDNDPKFVKWKNKGSIGVSLQNINKAKNKKSGIGSVKDGISISEIFGSYTKVSNKKELFCNHLIHIDPPNENAWFAEKRAIRRKNSKTILHFRIGSTDKKKPIWAQFPMIMHRPLPDNGRIKNASIHMKKVGTTEEWSLIIVVDMSDVITNPRIIKNNSIAVDLGWRQISDELRVAKWRDENNNIGEIKLNFNIINSIKKSTEIRSIRDKNFNEIKYKFINWLKNNKHPDWLKEKTNNLNQSRSLIKLVNLVKFWKNNRFNGDQEIFGVSGVWNKETKTLSIGTGLLGWMYKEIHLLNWIVNQRDKALKYRKEEYRKIAAELADKYKTLILEDFDLYKVSQKAKVEDDDDNQKARSNRTIAAPGEFREILVNAFNSRSGKVIKINPAYTSKICYLCNSKETLDNSIHIHTCSNCKQTWDRDDNATANILNCGLLMIKNNISNNGIIKETRHQRRNNAKMNK